MYKRVVARKKLVYLLVFSLTFSWLFPQGNIAKAINAPTNLTADVWSRSEIYLSWNGVSGAQGYDIQKATNSQFTQNLTTVSSWPQTDYYWAGLISGTLYYFRVRSIDGSGNPSSWTSTVSAMTQFSTPSLFASSVSQTSVNLDISQVNGAGSYTIQKSIDSGFNPADSQYTATASMTWAGLSPATTYYFRVRATEFPNDGGAVSLWSQSLTVITEAVPQCLAPTNLTATAISQTEIDLGWQDNCSSETKYFVERSTSPTSGFSQIAELAPNVTSYNNTGLSAGTTYYYRARLVNGYDSQYSSYSNTASARTADIPTCNPPTNLQTSVISYSEIDLSWQDNCTTENAYYVEKGTDGINFSQIAQLSENVLTYKDQNLVDGSKFYYRVRLRNGYDNSFSNYSNVDNNITTLKPPTNPQGSAIDNTKIDLSWTNNSSTATNVVIERKEGVGEWQIIQTLASTSTSYSDINLPYEGNRTFSYQIKAIQTTNNVSSAYTAPINITTPKAPAIPNLSTIGILPDLGTPAQIILSNDSSKAFIASNPFGFVAVDITNKAQMRVISSEDLPATAVRVSVSQDEKIAVMAGSSRGTDIVDISNILAPKVVASIAGASVDATIAGNYAYIATAGDVSVFDISVPAAVYNVATVVTPGSAYGVAVIGNKLVICDSTNGLVIADVTNPRTPGTPTTIPLGGGAWKVATKNIGGTDYAFVANSGLAKLQVIDLSTNTKIKEVDTGVGASNISVEGNYAYVCAGGNGLHIIDISNPSTAYLKKSFTNEEVFTTPFGAIGRDNYVYLAGGSMGLTIDSISTDMQNISKISSLAHSNNAVRVAVNESTKIGAAAGSPRGTDIIDFSDPKLPRIVSSIAGTAVDVTISGNYAYAAASGDFKIINIANPASPQVASTFVTPGSAYGVSIIGNKAVVADGTNGLIVFNIFNPSAPTSLGTITLGGTAWKVATRHIGTKDYAFVANSGLGSLQIIDLSTNTKIKEVATGVGASGVFVDDNYAYVCAGGNGLFVIDITTPSTAYLKRSFTNAELQTAPVGAVAQNGFIFAAGVTTGISVTDFRDPQNPQFISQQGLIGGSISLTIGQKHLYIANNKLEFQVMDIYHDELKATLTPSTYFASSGDEIMYTLAVNNPSPNVMTDAAISVGDIPDSVTFISADNGGTYNPTTKKVNWQTISAFLPNTSLTYTYRVRVN